MRSLVRALSVALLFSFGVPLLAAPSEQTIRKILANRVDVQKQGVGMVVGLIDDSGRKVLAHGVTERGGNVRVDGDTLFKIGSITKVFTALLLADAVIRGEVALTDPVEKHLPPATRVPERGGRKITLQDLANHHAGLPRYPSNVFPANPDSPFDDYRIEDLNEFLATFEFSEGIGPRYDYSNVGVGLLGLALAHRAGVEYDALLRERITGPLGMKNTGFDGPASPRARVAQGHDSRLNPVPMRDLTLFAPAGDLRSSANDLLLFLAAASGRTKTPLERAFALLPAKQWEAIAPDRVTLGWHVRKASSGQEVIWHNGATSGYRSFAGYFARTRQGVVVLSNAASDLGVDDLGFHLLDERAPLLAARRQADVDPAVLDELAGRYELSKDVVVTVTRDGDRLWAQPTGQLRYELSPESPRRYFFRALPAQITFADSIDGKAPSLTLHRDGMNMPGKRIADAPAPVERVAVPVTQTTIDRYLGRYRINRDVLVQITREDGALFAQLTAQAKHPIFAESERKFFYKAVNAQITFELDDAGAVRGLVLHQNGTELRAPRVK
jgi:D-alanyl-D-alanine-carboxypeptidase/D-alanyl-D-alanine-endopeptidase